MGLNTDAPAYAIDVVGDGVYAHIRSSGVIVGSSGVVFPSGSPDPGYAGGRQVEHFIRNELDSVTGSDEVLQLSGVVDQAILFKQQSKGQVLAGPPSGCGVGCSPAYPSFRYLTIDDLPDLSSSYVTEYGHLDGSHGDGTPSAGYVTIWKDDNVITFDTSLFFDTFSNRLGIGTTSPLYNLDVAGNARISSHLVVGGNLDVQGTTTYINSTNVTILDKQIELASMSGNRVYTDSLVDGAGIVVKSSGDGSSVIDGDKKWIWEDACNAWTAKGSLDQYNLIDVSGIIFNGDCNHLISGAYKAGSGLSLHGGLEFNVGNMFSLGTSPPQNIHHGDTILVSGVSGIATSLEQVGTNHILWVDPTELSGILNAGMADATSAGSGLISYADGSFNLNVPSGSYGELLAVDAVLAQDQVLVWDSGSYTFKYMSLGQLQSKIDTTAGGASTWDTVDVDDNQSAYTWGTSDVSTTSASETLHFVAGDHMSLSSADPSEAAIRFTNTGTPIVSGMVVAISGLLDEASGVLDNTINNLSGLVHQHTAGSGLVRYSDGSTPPNYSFNLDDPDVSYDAITAGGIDPSGEQILVWDDDSSIWKHMTFAELQTAIDTTGGGGDNAFKTIDVNEADTGIWSATENVVADNTTDTLNLVAGTGIQINSRDSDNSIRIYSIGSHTVSGMLEEASGALNNKIDLFVDPSGSHSGIAVFNGNNKLVDTYVGGSGMFWDSGNVSLSIGNVSDTVSSLFIDTVTGVRRALTIQASSPQTANLFEVRGSDGSLSGIYIDGKGDLTGYSAVGRGDAEFFAGREAAEGATDAVRSVSIGYQAGKSAYESNYSVFLGDGAGLNIIGERLGESNPATISNVGIGENALQDASGITRTVAVGYEAGRDAKYSWDSVWVGNGAGYKSSGDIQSVFIGDHAGTAATGSQDLIAMGWYAAATGQDNDYSNMMGYLAGALATGCNTTNMMGYKAGYQASVCGTGNMIGRLAGWLAIGCDSTNMIGNGAGQQANVCGTGNMIGYYAGSSAIDCNETNMIGSSAGKSASGCYRTSMVGPEAGYEATGCNYTDTFGYRAGMRANTCSTGVMIGSEAGSQATGCGLTNMMGYQAGRQAELCEKTNIIGYAAGKSAISCDWANIVGVEAGQSANGCNYTNMMGYQAGFSSDNCTKTNMVGYQAGLSTSGCDYTNMIGWSTGGQATGCDYTNMIGRYAGLLATDCNYTEMIGYNAGYQTDTCSTCIMIGFEAGRGAENFTSSIAIGYHAGREHLSEDSPPTGVDNVYIGSKAGYAHDGDRNISIISNADDTINKPLLPSDDRLNIANTIYGEIGTGRRISIGAIPTDFVVGATLAVKPYNNVVTTPTCWLMNNDNQASPILMSDTVYDLKDILVLSDPSQVAGIPSSNTFPHINSQGYFTLPMFRSDTMMKTAISATSNPGAIAFYWDTAGPSDGWRLAVCNGLAWYKDNSDTVFNTFV